MECLTSPLRLDHEGSDRPAANTRIAARSPCHLLAGPPRLIGEDRGGTELLCRPGGLISMFITGHASPWAKSPRAYGLGTNAQPSSVSDRDLLRSSPDIW